MPKSGSEQHQGLLQPEQFDIDDIDAVADTENVHEAYSRNRKSRAPVRWSRRKWVTIVIGVAALLMVAVFINKGAGIKIPKFHRPPPPPPEDLSDVEKPPLNGPVHPKLPLDVEPPTSPDPPTSAASPDSPTSAASPDSPTSAASPDSPKSPASPSSPSPAAHTTNPSSSPSEAPASSSSKTGTNLKVWEKPLNFKIIGLIFFGRPPVVAILDCYLKKNLVSNGGWLDEVQFVVNTPNEDDIGWLDVLVEDEPLYKKITKPEMGYNHIWELVEREHMYIKIDDDIVYFSDNAIPDLVWSKLNHTDSLNVVANLINSPETGFLHFRLGAIHSYLPELEEPKDADPDSLGEKAWRASKLPVYHERNMEWPIAGVRAGKEDDGSALPSEVPGAPPYKGHRWLPLPDNVKNLDKTPMMESSYDPNGPDWGSWSLGAQAHYSFLENLEKGELSRYYYGRGVDPNHEAIWHMMYQRMNINFMAIWGKDVLDNLPFDTMDDELALSVTVPLKLRRPLLVNTKAIAAHFAFRSQIEMHDTDLLSRYRAYANENVCKENNQIPYQKYST